MALAPSQPAAALAKLTPQETNARMEACLERISGVRPVFARRMMFPANAPAYSITETASWKCASEAQRNEALAAVEFALRPAAEDDIGAALYSLRIMTRGRDQRSDADREAEAMIWLAHLSRFPADIVLTVLKNWPMRPDGQWWPTWHDVQKELEAQTSSRRLLAEHLRSGACLPAPKPEAVEIDDSPEAVAKRQAFVEQCRMTRYDWKQVADGKEPLEVDPVNPIDDYLGWEAREKSRLADESKSGKFRLSDEALGISRRRTERDAA